MEEERKKWSSDELLRTDSNSLWNIYCSEIHTQADKSSSPSDSYSQISEVLTAFWASGEPNSSIYFTFLLACRDISHASLYIIGCRVCQQTVNDNFQMEMSVKREHERRHDRPRWLLRAGFQRLHIKVRPFPSITL